MRAISNNYGYYSYPNQQAAQSAPRAAYNTAASVPAQNSYYSPARPGNSQAALSGGYDFSGLMAMLTNLLNLLKSRNSAPSQGNGYNQQPAQQQQQASPFNLSNAYAQKPVYNEPVKQPAVETPAYQAPKPEPVSYPPAQAAADSVTYNIAQQPAVKEPYKEPAPLPRPPVYEEAVKPPVYEAKPPVYEEAAKPPVYEVKPPVYEAPKPAEEAEEPPVYAPYEPPKAEPYAPVTPKPAEQVYEADAKPPVYEPPKPAENEPPLYDPKATEPPVKQPAYPAEKPPVYEPSKPAEQGYDAKPPAYEPPKPAQNEPPLYDPKATEPPVKQPASNSYDKPVQNYDKPVQSYDKPVQKPVAKPGASADDPYVLNLDKSGTSAFLSSNKELDLPFGPKNAPQYLRVNTENGKTALYKAMDENASGFMVGDLNYERVEGTLGGGVPRLAFRFSSSTPKAVVKKEVTPAPAKASENAQSSSYGDGSQSAYDSAPSYGYDKPAYDYGYEAPAPAEEEEIYGARPILHSPLVMDLNGDGISTTEQNRQFDINGDGKQDTISSLGQDDATLMFDADGNGIAGENGKELFGNHTDLNGDGKADGFANGFDALKAFASQKLGAGAVSDGKLDAAEIAQLEQSGLKMSVGGQLKSLSALGVDGINLGYQNSDKADRFGNEFRQLGSFSLNGQQRQIADLWYAAKQNP